MTIFKLNSFFKAMLLSSCLLISGCVGTLVGAVVDTTIEVVKIPFKVGGAIVDVVSGDEEFTQSNDDRKQVLSENTDSTDGQQQDEQVSF